MKKFMSCLLTVATVFLLLTLTTSSAPAQKWCQHIHQVSKKLVGQITTLKKCDYCTREKMEVYYVHQKIKGSVVQDCDCDETNDDECDLVHGHPVSDDGDWEAMGCAFTDPSLGFPGNSEFTATIKRWIKYCKNGLGGPGLAWPLGGYHKGTWKITDGIDGAKLASGSLKGSDGVEPSLERGCGSCHDTLPSGQKIRQTNYWPPWCNSYWCYQSGWEVGCLSGKTTNTFFSQSCPPSNSYGDLNDDTTWEKWKVKACYSGGRPIDPTDSPCAQWGTPDWYLRLEGVIAIKAP